MRISVRENPKIAMHCLVFVDGVDVSKRCFEAETGAGIAPGGYALCYVFDENGKPVLAKDRLGIETEILYGKVEIRLGAV